MNTQEYIESGKLEAYILGELSLEEIKEVENYADRYPEIKQELARLEEDLEFVYKQQAIEPPHAVRDKVMRSLDLMQTTKFEESKPIQLPNRSLWKWATAASISLLLVSAVLASTYFSKWKEAEERISLLIAQNGSLAQDLSKVGYHRTELQRQLQISTDPSYQRIVLTTTQENKKQSATIFWNPSQNKVFVQAKDLNPLREDQDFQLWAIVDGQPMDLGVFSSPEKNEISLLSMAGVARAEAFAVTIEPKGGSETPSLEQLQVYGEI